MGQYPQENNNEPYLNNKYQESVSITKQDQSQSYSNSTMCHTLSTAENLAFRICLESNNKQYFVQFFDGYKQILRERYQNEKLIFDAYDSFDGGKKKQIKDLAAQLIFQIENFKGDYSYYISQYQKYDFPRNLSQEQVINLIYHWYTIINKIELDNEYFRQNHFSKYYFNLILIIKGQKSYDYTQDIFNFEANNPNLGKINPTSVMDAYGKINRHNDQYVSNNAKTKEVQLYGENTLKNNNNYNQNNNHSGAGKGGIRGEGRGRGRGGGGGRGRGNRGSNNSFGNHEKIGDKKNQYNDDDEFDNK